MPYIKEEHRKTLEPIIDNLLREIANIQLDDNTANVECIINYFMLKLLSNVYSVKTQGEIYDVIGLLECCKLEFYRKTAASINDQEEYDQGEI